MLDSHRLRLACTALIGAMLVFAAGAAAKRSARGPHIVARPIAVMVNRTTTLTGGGFAAHHRIQLLECGATFWIVPRDPCVSRSAITVTTNATGGFTIRFKVSRCPSTSPTVPPASKERCYVGEAHPVGVDTVSLVGAAPITVTYP